MNAVIAAKLREWQDVFTDELSAQLSQLHEDKDIYGFALEVPEDLADPGITTVVGRKSKLIGKTFGTLTWLNQKYCPVEWDYLPNAHAYHRSCVGLERISQEHQSDFISDTSEYTDEGSAYRDALYEACLDVMERCNAAGSFGDIAFKIIFLSDADHPIVGKSLHRLNPHRGWLWRKAVGLCVR